MTKGFGPEAVTAALGAGLSDLGENYAQELRDKDAAVSSAGRSVRWHYLGAIQRATARILGGRVALWQGVDNLESGRRVARSAPGGAVLVQVNVTGEAGRRGCTPEETAELVRVLRDIGLTVEGLMAIGPRPPDGHRPDARTTLRA
ncbi:MAG: alanine racemase, partial [Acidimicrobiales bacterium]